ncbi:Na+/H+ antiporter NhaA [Jatrophihabitans telluris]|uniref:Na(+)/H(+) antiporter NhaA n=1 Tax=Jatrophihabitans telluris TaxID=2038343 RepID=A0ABY4QYY4_9ACTN|nr:Na+/H+ antiporter NhaA [Jatrophihabitans telluris]UQX88848.1 Na+/H+ antiporter NhaA [Jatrophihabitans telluris]
MTTSLRPGPPLRFTTPQMTPSARRFIANEAGSAAVLLGATVIALVWANSPFSTSYFHFWNTPVRLDVGRFGLDLDLRHVVNDAAMAVFFLVLGLEISRETVAGELRNRRTLAVPACGAIGGMVVPIAIYLAINHSGPAAHGWGIVMSSDTAFVLGVLALFGPRCPDQLRLFLLALAVVDDIGAISVMAIFYTDHVHPVALAIALALFGCFVLLRWLGVWRLTPFVLLGLGFWLATYASGVHPTLAGVLTGLMVPAYSAEESRRRELLVFGRALIENPSAAGARLASLAASATVSASERLQNWLHPWSAYFVIPAFGLANAGVSLSPRTLADAVHSEVAVGIAVALVVGNAVGITLFSTIALRTHIGTLPGRVRYSHLFGGAVLAGMGFTISLFITDLAFDSATLRDEAKIGILAGSLLAALLGAWILRIMGERTPLCTPAGDDAPAALPPLPWSAPGFGPAGPAVGTRQ